MADHGSQDQRAMSPNSKILDFDATSPYLSRVENFAYNWLNGRLLRLDRHVPPPIAPFSTVRCTFYDNMSYRRPARYVLLRYLGEALIRGTLVTRKSWAAPHEVYYKMADGLWMQDPLGHFRVEDFLQGRWDLIDSTKVPDHLQHTPYGTRELSLYHWPKDFVTLLGPDEDDVVRHTQYKVLSTHTAIECLHRIQTHQLELGPCNDPADELDQWADIDCVWDSSGTAHAMQARHNSDYQVQAGFRLHDERWIPVPFSEVQHLTQWPEDHKATAYRLVVEHDASRPRFYLHNVTAKRWYEIFMESPEDATSETEEYEPRHVTAHINAALGSSRDDSRWRFKKCFKYAKTGGGWRGPETGIEPSKVGQQVVKLFICEREDGTIVDRVVVKTGDKDTFGRDQDEVRRSERLAALDTQNCIVKFRGWSRHTLLPKGLHAYIAWAPHGSLYGLIKSFDERGKLVPEMFIWLLIRNLVRACKVVESDSWVHPDIKPDNIFLDDARGDTDYPAYCNPVLGDFDVMVKPSETFNQPIGTFGWLTYEQLPEGYNTPIYKLHVQAIGLIAWALWSRSSDGTRVYNIFGAEVQNASQLPCTDERPFPAEEDSKMYSVRLRKIIERCLNHDLDDRPSLEELGDEADKVIAILETTRYPGIKKTREEELPENMQLDLGADRWPIGGRTTKKRRRREE